jgi:hypothetical protein
MGRHPIDSLAEQKNISRVGDHGAGDKIEQGCLPRAVRPHDAEDFTLIYGETDVSHRGDAAEAFRDGFEVE